MKRFFSLILSFALLLPNLEVLVNAIPASDTQLDETVKGSEGTVYTSESKWYGTCGDNLTWKVDDDTGILTISGTGAMANYTKNSHSPWYWYFESIRSVIIENGVTSIGTYAFYDCIEITTVTIPGSVISIGERAFARCFELTSVTISEGVTNIGDSAFNECSSLTNVIIPESVNSIGIWVFSNCYSLASVTISGSVTNIGEEVFSNCTSLTSVTIPNSVTSIGSAAFYNCSSLKSVTIPGSVTSIGSHAFWGCDGLSNVTIPGSVTSIGSYAFWGCDGLTSVTIPGSITSIGSAVFYYCGGLTSVTICEGVTSIGKEAFYACGALMSVAIPSSMTSIDEEAFYRCNVLQDVYYFGTRSQREKISIGYFNSPLELADWHYSAVHEHSFGGWIETKAPTCTEAGEETRVCIDCDVDERRDILATGHSYSEWMQIKAPTATVEGIERRYCENCDHYEDRTVAALNLSAPIIKISVKTATGKPVVTWSEVNGATLYRVYRAISKTGTYTRIKSTASLSFTDSSAQVGQNYYYKVKAVNQDNNRTSVYSNIVNRVCDLKQPVVTMKVDTASGKPKLEWGVITGAVKYRIYRATSKTGTYMYIKTTTSNKYIDTSAVVGKNCYYKVKALYTNSAADSAYSAVVNRVCDLAKPTVTLTLTDSGNPWVKWTAVEDADGYEVWRATSKSGTYKKVKTTVSGTSFADRDVKAGTKYYYKVRAIHDTASANSAYSAVKYITAK